MSCHAIAGEIAAQRSAGKSHFAASHGSGSFFHKKSGLEGDEKPDKYYIRAKPERTCPFEGCARCLFLEEKATGLCVFWVRKALWFRGNVNFKLEGSE